MKTIGAVIMILLLGCMLLNACSGGCNCSKWQPKDYQETKDEK